MPGSRALSPNPRSITTNSLTNSSGYAMKKKPRLERSPLARDDLKRLRKSTVAAGAPRSAKAFVSRLRKYVARLRDFPESGAVVENYHEPRFREIACQSQ